MHCPRCDNIRLIAKRIKEESLEVEVCPKCRGIWFDRTELKVVLDDSVEQLHVPDGAIRLDCLCPKCERALYLFKYPQTDIGIDMCKKCEGFWLESGEFRRIQVQRDELKRAGLLDREQPIPGVKGILIRMINDKIEELLESE